MSNPKISVITTCYNSGPYLEKTISSILNQNHDDYELIIIDAGSTDETANILLKYNDDPRMKTYTVSGISFYEGLRLASEKTTGEYLMCMPITDAYNSTQWFNICEDILNSNLDISLVHGISIHNDNNDNKFFGSATREECPSGKDFLPFWSATFFSYAEHTFCIRKRVYQECIKTSNLFEVKEYNKKFANDIDAGEMDSFNLFLVLSYNFNRLGYLSKFVPVISGLVRIHKESNSINYANSNAINADYYVKMVKNYREQLFSGKIIHHFRNGNGNIIDYIEDNNLKNYIKKTVNYRMYEKIYFSSNDHLNNFSKKFIFIIRRFLSRIFRNIIYLYYKCHQVINIK